MDISTRDAARALPPDPAAAAAAGPLQRGRRVDAHLRQRRLGFKFRTKLSASARVVRVHVCSSMRVEAKQAGHILVAAECPLAKPPQKTDVASVLSD